MSWNNLIRQFHRWVSAAFVIVVLITWVTLAKRGPIWVSYTPLVPLALLALSGVYMFFRPYLAQNNSKPRSARP